MKKIFCVLFCILMSLSAFGERPVIRDLQASRSKGTKISIYWTLPENPDFPITSIRLYRNTKQITSSKQLSSSTLIAELSPDSTGYVDSVKDFKDYYYAAIAVIQKSENKTKAYDAILISMNATVNGVHLEPAKKSDVPVDASEPEEKLYEDGSMRETPLPYLDLVDGLDAESQISDKTVAQAMTLSEVNLETEKDRLLPYYFEEDLVSPDDNDAYLLFNVLKNTFVQQKYFSAIPQLSELTKKSGISDAVLNRAYFYLGESYYFTGKYSEAVIAFIQVEKVYPELTKKWVNKSLDKIAVTKQSD